MCCVGSVEIPKSKYKKLVYFRYRIKRSLTGLSSERNMFTFLISLTKCLHLKISISAVHHALLFQLLRPFKVVENKSWII